MCSPFRVPKRECKCNAYTELTRSIAYDQLIQGYCLQDIIVFIDIIWRHRSASALHQVMACCLTTPSHYPNQWWIITSEVPWPSSPGRCDNRNLSHQSTALANTTVCIEIADTWKYVYPRVNELMPCSTYVRAHSFMRGYHDIFRLTSSPM